MKFENGLNSHQFMELMMEKFATQIGQIIVPLSQLGSQPKQAIYRTFSTCTLQQILALDGNQCHKWIWV